MLAWYGSCYFLVPNKKVTKEVGTGEGLSSLLPQSKPSLPCVPLPRALTMVQLRLSVAILYVPVGKNAAHKNMETGVQCAIRRTLVIRNRIIGLGVRISERIILLAAGDCKGGAFARSAPLPGFFPPFLAGTRKGARREAYHASKFAKAYTFLP